MKKEDILEMSRKENKNKDLYEAEIEVKGSKIATIVMLLLATVYYCYEIFTAKGQNITLYSLITIYCAVIYGYKAIKFKKRKRFNLICSIIWFVVTISLILQYFKVM